MRAGVRPNHLHLREEVRALRPPFRRDEHLGRVAVEARVLRDHARHVPRLVRELGLGPRAGDDEHRRHAAELRGEGDLVLLLLSRLLAPRLLGGVTAPHDRVVGAIAARDVQRVDLRMRRQVRADVGAAVDDGQEAVVDQRAEGLLEVRPAVGVDRVHLEDDDLVLDEQLVEKIHGRDARHVAGPEHRARPCPCDLRARGRCGPGSPACPSGFHTSAVSPPNIELVLAAGWEDAHDLLPVGPLRD